MPSPQSPQPSPDDFRWLVGPAAGVYLQAATEAENPLQAASIVRKLGPVRAHLVAEQVRLRERARQKFRHPQRMFFTARGLQQATDQWIAEHKAARFAPHPVLDLCTGVGGDLIALAARCREVTLVDADPCMTVLAEANVNALAPEAMVNALAVPVEDLDPQAFPRWHADPDRRPQGARVSQLLHTSPDVSVLDAWTQAAEEAAIKLAPATQVPDNWKPRAEREWITRDRECRQQVAWLGRLARNAGQHRATRIDRGANDEAVVSTIIGAPGVTVDVAAAVRRYVFEPDPAVLAANLTGALAARHALAALDARAAYFTGDTLLAEPLLAAFEVTEVLPLDRKQLRRLLADRGIGRLEIKQRGTGIDPARLRRDLRLRGSGAATLLAVRIGSRVTAILARRC